jgi:hypothetical protein
VIAVAITSHEQRAGFPLTLELSSKLGKVLPEELEQVVKGLNEILGG